MKKIKLVAEEEIMKRLPVAVTQEPEEPEEPEERRDILTDIDR